MVEIARPSRFARFCPMRQTASYLRRRFQETGLSPETRHGQNFLIDLNLVDLLVRTADPRANDVILEVGTGTGSLTATFANQAAEVVTVEIDGRLFQLAREALEGRENVTMLHQDVLRNKNNFHPRVMETVRQRLRSVENACFKLAANLPYSIATPVVSNLLLVDPPPATMTVTIQKELAERITAEPNSKDYGALSVWIQSQCDAEIIRIMPPTVFWPRPKVHSAIVHIAFREEKRRRIADLDYFHEFTRAMFFHRRKFLRSVLLSAYKKRMSKPQADAIFAQMEFGPTTRTEQLDVETMIRFCDVVRREMA